MTLYVNDPDFTLYVGDVRDVLATLPDESAHCVVTSPPYWGLRDYSVGGQLGLEATPDLYVENMVAVFREVRRVLRRDGTCWLNLGDSYAQGHGGSSTEGNGATMRKAARGAATNPERREPLRCTWCGWLAPSHTALAEHVINARHNPDDDGNYRRKGGVRNVVPGLKPKDLVGMPWRVAFALQADGWYLRADVVWSKPNPMPESVSDRPTKAHEYLFLLTRSPRYFYDADAIREAHTGPNVVDGQWTGTPAVNRPGWEPNTQGWNKADGKGGGMVTRHREYNPAGRNRRSVWEIATEAYPDAHFATFPQALVEPCVKAGTSERGCCPECGAPWEREVERMPVPASAGETQGRYSYDPSILSASSRGIGKSRQHYRSLGMEGPPAPLTTGWRPSCGHGLEPVPCTVLDPFMGSGTTALVARRLGRRSVGVELNETYAGLAARRLAQLSLLA